MSFLSLIDEVFLQLHLECIVTQMCYSMDNTSIRRPRTPAITSNMIPPRCIASLSRLLLITASNSEHHTFKHTQSRTYHHQDQVSAVPTQHHPDEQRRRQHVVFDFREECLPPACRHAPITYAITLPNHRLLTRVRTERQQQSPQLRRCRSSE